MGQATQPAQSVSAQAASPAAPKSQPGTLPAAPPPAARPSASFSAPIVVTLPQRVELAPAAAQQKVARMPPDRAALTRDLQRELKRVGCYSGEFNGTWTAATRKAMKAFTDRVNATLPIDDPDDILLTLVQAHPGEVCGKPCPAGQGLSQDGRCLPSAILAQAARKSPPSPAPAASRKGGRPAETGAPAITGWSTTTAAAIATPRAAGVPPPMGRMALAGPKSDAPAAAAVPPPGPGSAARHPKKPAAAARRARQAAVRERRPERYVQRTYARRSNFVESVLRNPYSIH
jgi:hypothetical protein